MALDGVLLEARKRCGGALKLARQLGVSKQAIYGFANTGIPEERIYQLKS